MTLTVYAFFLSSVVGQQYIQPLHEHEDFYFPIYASLQFIFYVGWLKVAETLINPWGEDDDDFDTNYMVDRNIQFAFLLIDQVIHSKSISYEYFICRLEDIHQIWRRTSGGMKVCLMNCLILLLPFHLEEKQIWQ